MLVLLILGGPRLGIIFWWIANPTRWDTAFSSVIWPILGFVFLPWTTLTFVAVAPFGNVAGGDWVWLALAFVLDITSAAMSGYNNRYRVPNYA